MKKKNRRKRFLANKLHKDMFYLIFFAALIPAVIVTVLLYYLIFNITADQFGIPEVIAYNIIPAARRVIIILLYAAPLSIFVILMFAYKMTHKIVGPFDRIVRELDECAKGKKKDRIVIRESDKFSPLVKSINKLLDKIK